LRRRKSIESSERSMISTIPNGRNIEN